MNKRLTANILFSGIGCQERGIANSKLFDVDIKTTSDISKEAILAYAVIHCGLTNEMIATYSKYPTKEEMIKELMEKNIGFDIEKSRVFNWSKKSIEEIKKYWLAVKLSKNAGDISKIESLPYADLWTCSFPCTDISAAGKMKGLNPNDSTHSSLLWENIRLLKKAKNDGLLPKYLLFENVKNLVSKRFINDFNDLLEILNNIGYNSYWKVLNAKDCGIPQDRERVFVICIRKDIDKGTFTFPKPIKLKVKLKDLLDEQVDAKYYLKVQKQVSSVEGDQQYIDNLSNTQVFVKRKLQSLLDKRDGTLPELFNAYNCKELKEYAPTVTTQCSSATSSAVVLKKEANYRIRKYTPIECWRLMGFDSNDCIRVKEIGIADGQLYKQAGNGIVINCVELLMEHLYKAQYEEKYVCTDEKE